MERRKFVIGLGSLAAGGAAAMGTGAFSGVQADRDISVEVAGDASAYLQMKAPDTLENGEYADGPGETGNQLSLTFDSSATSHSGSGVNADAISRFDEVFMIINEGTQEVNLHIDDEELSQEAQDRIRFYTTETGGRKTLEDGEEDSAAEGEKKIGVPVGAGQNKTVGVEIDTREVTNSGGGSDWPAIDDPSDWSVSGEVTIYTEA
ncbi:DUF1102 domain-containing protein [Halolamina sp. CBA1230]|uniref:DUF1102 domain-containing protein n=1 Tax=Halolamina sp. CBA1230 TaxID=1853690 RepID=UPI0009A13AAF|nr:DUF1102 domain-containing protein [Halolamina sp. CBA1230]QKY20402.1 DUF1102 domain-containing protein [Halolamina sp. CBA1230]